MEVTQIESKKKSVNLFDGYNETYICGLKKTRIYWNKSENIKVQQLSEEVSHT
jgi:hypothetical protein